ncbi:MAG TPA: hypothetical protein PKD54_01355 [Pirellulaceae bacterium]|nr:hypothetical protein [Pirellulaceae bacterium]
MKFLPLLLAALIGWQDPLLPGLRPHRFHVTRSGVVRGIPQGLPYQWRPRSGSVSELSRTPLTLRDADSLVTDIRLEMPLSPTRQVKWFAFDPLNLQIDECALSAASVTVDDRGNWELTLRAAVAHVDMPQFNPNEHLRRNELVARLTWYVDVPGAVGAVDRAAIRPAVAQTESMSFIVQRGDSETICARGQLDGLRREFDLLQRAEIEFFYRHGTARHAPAYVR